MIPATTDAEQKTRSSQSSSANRRSTYIYAAMALISLVGLADATYLTIQHVTGQSVRCTIVSGCSEVLSSQYAVVAGKPLALIGAAAYFTVFALATLGAFGYRFVGVVLYLLVASMLLVSLWLTYLQAFVIRSFCQYCLLSAAITLTLGTLLYIRSRNP